MEDLIIIGVIAVLAVLGIRAAVKHFKGEGGCCGGGSTYVSKKKLKNVIAKKTIIIEGMTCEHCKSRVERYLNDISGVAGKVNLKKKEAAVSMDREVSDDVLCAAVEKAGYEVVEIR